MASFPHQDTRSLLLFALVHSVTTANTSAASNQSLQIPMTEPLPHFARHLHPGSLPSTTHHSQLPALRPTTTEAHTFPCRTDHDLPSINRRSPTRLASRRICYRRQLHRFVAARASRRICSPVLSSSSVWHHVVIPQAPPTCAYTAASELRNRFLFALFHSADKVPLPRNKPHLAGASYNEHTTVRPSLYIFFYPSSNNSPSCRLLHHF
jgi:hypothetical protein